MIEENRKGNNCPKRRSRIFRSKNPRPVALTKRRIDELEILYHHRLATTDVFQAVLEGSDKRIQEELREVWDFGYIDRPPQQWMIHKIYNQGHGRSEIIYALANKGLQVLQEFRELEPAKTDLGRKNKELGETTIFHDVVLTKIWAGLKAGLDQKRARTKENYNLLLWYQDRPDREQLITKVRLTPSKTINIVPDAAFKLQCPKSKYLFFVEYYRTNKGGHQNYLDKLKLYNLYFEQKLFAKYDIKKGFRVITLAPSRTIVKNLISLINTGNQNKELKHFRFWFVSETDFRLYKKEKVVGKTYYKKINDVESILNPIFRTPIDKKWHSLEE